jgi:hypothetical protein
MCAAHYSEFATKEGYLIMRMNRQYTTVGETLRGVELAFRGMIEGQGIKVLSCNVISHGETASVRYEGNKLTGFHIALCMPWVSQEATVSLDDVHMFTASWMHEGDHVIDSDMEVMMQAGREGLSSLLNYIEDVRVDTRGAKRGTHGNLVALRSERIEQLAARSAIGREGEAPWTGFEAQYAGWSLKCFGLMINAGYDCPTIKKVWDNQPSKVQAKWRKLLARVAACQSTQDALDLARALTTEKEKGETRKGDDDDDEGRCVNPGEGDDEGETRDTGDDEGDDEGETGEGDKREGGDDEGDEGDDEGQPGDDDEGETGDDEGDDDEGGKGIDDTGDDEGDDTGETGEGDEGGEGDDEPIDFSDFENNNKRDDELTGEDVQHLRIDDGESKDDEGHNEEHASTAISSYKPGNIKTTRISDTASRDVANSTPIPAKLRNLILGLLRAPEKTDVRRFKTSGRFDSRAMLRATTGAADVFKRRFRQEGMNTAVTLIVDCSISMSTYVGSATLMNRAAQFAYALSVCIEATGQSCEVFGFGDQARSRIWNNVDDQNGYTDQVRINQCSLFPVKTRREKVRHVLGKFDSLSRAASGGTPLSAAMLDATTRLVNERATRRVLLCLTDGECNSGPLACKMAQRMAWAQGVEIVGIGCGYDCSESFYDSENFMDVNEMTQGGLAKLIKKLNSPARRLDSKRVA